MCEKVFNILGTENNIRVEIADTFFKRFLGLMGRKTIERGAGLLITPCNSIHMMFMRFSIDAVYLDKDMRVLKVAKNLKPWISLSICRKAESTLEMRAGEAKRLGVVVGHRLVEI